MRHLKTFESFNGQQIDEGFGDKIKQALGGGKTFDITGKDLPALKAKYVTIKNDGKVVTAATKLTKWNSPLFFIVDGKLFGNKQGSMTTFTGFKNEYNMTDDQALEALCKIWEANGEQSFSYEKEKCKFEDNKFVWIKGVGTRGSGFNN